MKKLHRVLSVGLVVAMVLLLSAPLSALASATEADGSMREGQQALSDEPMDDSNATVEPGKAVSYNYWSVLTVTETITPEGGGYRYSYAFTNVGTSPIWHFGVWTAFNAGYTTQTPFSGWAWPADGHNIGSVISVYDARNLGANITWVSHTWAPSWPSSPNSIPVGTTVSGFSYWSTTYDASPKYYFYETYGSYAGSTGKVTAVGLTTAANWTFMVYLDADNDLEGAGIDDLNEMEVVGSTSAVNIVVLMDRAEGYDYTNGNWTDAKVFYVTQDANTSTISSTVVATPGEVNMGDPDTLVDFATWTIANYPANHYALVLWDHGSGWKAVAPSKGIAWDESSANDYLTTPELGAALSAINATTGVTFDVLGFDACLMQMLEVGYQIKDYADIMVGSEENEPIDGWPYNTILAGLTTTPSMTGSALATRIVTDYMAFYGTTGIETQSAVQLSIDTVANATSELAQAIINAGVWSEVTTARAAVEEFADPDYIDLYHFAQLMSTSSDATVAAKASALMTAITANMVAEEHGTGNPDAHGISIYFPQLETAYLSYYGVSLDFTAATQWDESLRAYYGPPSVTITPLSPDPHPDNTPTLSGTATDAASPIFSVEYRVDGGSWFPATAVDGTFDSTSEDYTFTTVTLTDGLHTVEVRATDTAGNVTPQANYASDSFTVDTTGPSVTLTPLSPDPHPDNTPTLSGTATDSAINITSVEYRVDGGSWFPATAVDGTFDSTSEDYTFTTSALADGSHLVEVRATDALGNITAAANYASDTFTVDTTGPSVTLTPLSPDPHPDNTPTLSGTATDSAINITSVEYRVDGGSWIPATAVDGAFDSTSEDYTFTTSALLDGAHTVEVRATDALGNITAVANYASDTFTVDTTGPSVTLTPLSPDPHPDNTPTFTGNATDSLSLIASVEYRVWTDLNGNGVLDTEDVNCNGILDTGEDINGNGVLDAGELKIIWTAATASDGAFDSTSENYIFTTTTLADGSYIVEVRAGDAAGNVTLATGGTYASDTFTVDTTLDVNKSVSLDKIWQAGMGTPDETTVTLTVEGPGTNIVVTDVLPSYIVPVAGSYSTPPTSTTTDDVSGKTTLVWNVGDLGAGGSWQVSFKVKSNEVGLDKNVDVVANSKVTYTDYAGVAASKTFPEALISVYAPLTVQKSVDVTEVWQIGVGTPYKTTVTLIVTGPGKDIVVTEVLPDYVNLEGGFTVTPDVGYPIINPDGTRTIQWTVGMLLIERTWTVSFDVSFNVGGTKVAVDVANTGAANYAKATYKDWTGATPTVVLPQAYVAVKAPLTVEVNVAPVYFAGLTAEAYILTTIGGEALDANIDSVKIYFHDGTEWVDLTSAVEKVPDADGLYRVEYKIPGDAPMGGYKMIAKASAVGLHGTSSGIFQVLTIPLEIMGYPIWMWGVGALVVLSVILFVVIRIAVPRR